MKTPALTLVATLALSSLMASEQGVLQFSNIGVGLDAPVTNWDGAQLPVAGHKFTAELLYAPGIVADPTLLISLATTGFVTNGYFAGGVVAIPGATAGTVVTIQVRVWDPCPFDAYCPTFQLGVSDLFQVAVTSVPYPPASLTGLRPFGVAPPTTYSPPRITVDAIPNNKLLFAWLPSAVGTNFVLQQNADLNTTNWVTVEGLPILVGPRFELAVPKPPGTTFYRLAQSRQQ